MRGSNSIGACCPTGSHKAKACKGTVEATSAASAAETAVPNFIVGICDDMIWNDMWWYVGIWWDLIRFHGIWWGLMVSYIVLLHASKKICQTHVRFWVDLEGCHFIVLKNCLWSGAPILYGGCPPKMSHKAKACKGTLKAASAVSAASAAETAVPNFILGICDDMWGFDGIWWDLMGFDGFFHRASTCFYMLQKKNAKKNVRFWVDLKGCHLIVPKNCLRSGVPIL